MHGLLFVTLGSVLSTGVCSATPLQAVRWFWNGGVPDESKSGVFERPADLVHRSWYGLTTVANFEDVYRREGVEASTTVRFWSTHVGYTVPLPGALKGILSLEGRTSDLHGNAPTDGGHSITDVLDGRTLGGLQYAHTIGRHLVVGGGLRSRARASPPVFDWSLQTIFRTPEWSADLRSVEESWVPSLTILDADDTIVIDNSFRILRYAMAVGVHPGHRLDLRIEGETARIRPEQSGEGYVARVSGQWKAGAIDVQSEVNRRLAINGGIRLRSVTGRLSGQLDEEEFSRGTLWGSSHVTFLGVTWSRGEALSAELRGFDAYTTSKLSKGSFESWPFISAFASLFAGKDWLVKGDGDVWIRGCGVKSTQRAGGHLELMTVLNFVHLWPRAELRTLERPKFDVIGLFLSRSERRELSIQGIDLLDLGIRPSYRLNKIRIGYSLTQLLPLRVKRAPGFVSPPRERVRERGGRSHTIIVSYPVDSIEGDVYP